MSDALVFPGVRSARFVGCLHGLALLRVVNEQLDPTARAAWSHGSFVLTSTASRDELVTFFVERWRPTPAFSPWNGSSGFHAGDGAGETSLGLLEASTEPRLQELRDAIAAVRRALAHRGLGEQLREAAKTRNPAKIRAAKVALLRHLRANAARPRIAVARRRRGTEGSGSRDPGCSRHRR